MDRTAIDILIAAVAANPDLEDKPALQEAILYLVTGAECAWDDQTAMEAEEQDVHFPGIALYEKFPLLSQQPGQHLRRIIETAADDPAVPRNIRDFLYFLLGYLRCGQEEMARRVNL